MDHCIANDILSDTEAISGTSVKSKKTLLMELLIQV